RDPGQDHVPQPAADALRRAYVTVLYPGEAVLVQLQEIPHSSSWPRTNVGSDRPTSTPTVDARSNRLRGRVALMMPTPRPTISQSTTPPMTTDAVRGRSWARIVLTDSPLA